MPRFLDTWTGKFVWEPDPTKVVYAILSHTWRSEKDGGEQSYSDVIALQIAVEEAYRDDQRWAYVASVQELRERRITTPSAMDHIHRYCRAPNTSRSAIRTILSYPDLSSKIKDACRVAREAGFCLLWIDSCCIDKSSSAELSEAINSMYEWYRLADMCYAYLEDVLDLQGVNPDAFSAERHSAFERSRWHKRTWTLQELIAPERVEFLSKDWCFLGTKMVLASTLWGITGVSVEILTGQVAVDSASVAQRMQWAAHRETTRIEDQAYCLLGLFGVHLSPIYGEGRNAFLRLQEEVIKTVPDQSIFAWGPIGTMTLQPKVSLDALSLPYIDISTISTWGALSPPGLLAKDPQSFDPLEGRITEPTISSLSPEAFAARLGRSETSIPPLHSVFTPQGTRLQLLCVDLALVPHSDLFRDGRPILQRCHKCGQDRPMTTCSLLALLPCADQFVGLLALPLCRPMFAIQGQGAYMIALQLGKECNCGDPPYGVNPIHALRLEEATLVMLLPHLLPTAVKLSLLHHCFDAPILKSRQSLPLYRSCLSLWTVVPHRGTDFCHIVPGCTERLAAQGFGISPLRYERSEDLYQRSVMSSLTSGPFRTCDYGDLQQTIQLRVTLTWPILQWPQRGNGTVCISVANSIHALSSSTNGSYLRRVLTSNNRRHDRQIEAEVEDHWRRKTTGGGRRGSTMRRKRVTHQY